MGQPPSDRSVPVAPDAVRVWRGFRLPSLSEGDFFKKLGSIFIPGTVQIQAPVGLTAYMPSVLPAVKSPVAPDEIALVFYEVQNAYHEAKETVGGRAYSDLHALVFDLSRSTSGFPVKFAGDVEAEMRYHLFDDHVDWQLGVVNTFVGTRRGDDAASFMAAVGDWLGDVQSAGGPDGAVAVVAADYVTYWEHWPDAAAAADSPIPGLAELAEPAYHHAIQSHRLDVGLWEKYKGVEVNGGESFNFRFRRRMEDD